LESEKDKLDRLRFLESIGRNPLITNITSQYELEIVKRIVSMDKKLDLILKKIEELENELKKKGII
jgi:hypothetical protein